MTPVSLYEEDKGKEEHLVLSHMALVRRVAVHLKARIPPFMEIEELVQVGMVGLIEAAQNFDASRGVSFELYALRRVRGAMLDEVRRQSFLPRSAVAFKRTEQDALHVLEGQLGRRPSDLELAEFMGESAQEYQRRRDASSRSSTSIEMVNEEIVNVPMDASLQPEALVERSQALEHLSMAIDKLEERARLVMSLYYVDELNLKEIGSVIGVSESRVSQILSATVEKLRVNLNGA